MSARTSDLSVTDMFCGAGGSSLGAHANGLNVRLAMNHWKRAIETHNTNFPDTDHACTDIQACEPRAFYATDILVASPECTNHSLAKGVKRKRAQIDAFDSVVAKPEEIRSRATMWDVPRFAEVHRYRAIVVENVPDARHWVMFDAWLMAMHALGYAHQCVYLNSKFAHPTPQSRDRMYVVFWQKGNRAPDLEIRPSAPCGRCGDVEAVQSWKPGRNWGRYGRQYLYCCPRCGTAVEPYYFAALNVIDWSLPATRIGDRKTPLRPKTLARIAYGMERFGRQPLVVHTRMTHAVRNAVVINTSHGAMDARSQSALLAMPTQTTAQELGIALPPLLVPAGSNPGHAVPATEPTPTLTTSDRLAVVVPPSALVTLRDMKVTPQLVRPVTDAMGTQVATATQDFLVSRAPFLLQYYGQSDASGLDAAVPTVTTVDRNALVEPGPVPDIDDCHFRMLQPDEVRGAMAFPGWYVITGTNRERVKQLGNAVTPPAMQILLERVVQSLTGDRAA
jgi:DNA (cytosine-5)-methyltransferase 1